MGGDFSFRELGIWVGGWNLRGKKRGNGNGNGKGGGYKGRGGLDQLTD